MKVSIKVLDGPVDVVRVIDEGGGAYRYDLIYASQEAGSVMQVELQPGEGVEVRAPMVDLSESGAAEQQGA